jgi:hypothetical protein
MARKVADTEIRFASGDSVVESDYAKVKNGFRFFSWGNDGTLPFVHYTITMPRSAKLRIDDYKSRISVEGIAGTLDLETYKGTGKLSGFEDRVKIETYKGDLELTMARSPRTSSSDVQGSYCRHRAAAAACRYGPERDLDCVALVQPLVPPSRP